jgi:eukaryotic-like serine/threonine-protein kinase
MSAPERGKVIAGRYRLDRVLAQGGMGSVWVGHHLQLDVPVAVKFMAPYFAASAEARARFEREAKASAQLRIANAVQVYDFGIEDGTPFITMELLDGEDLHARLDREKRLTPAATLVILNQVCIGLRRAHDVGLVHRDLKPANIFLSRQGREEVAKILDFGIAKAPEPAAGAGGAGATKTGTLLGTPHYMSPEQVRSTSKVDLRSDLWALGVIAFRCVTGQLPFPGDEMGEVLIDVCTKAIPVPSHIAPDLPPELDRFFERALMRDPAQRFQDADELADAFADAQEPVTMLARGEAIDTARRTALASAARPPEPVSSGALPSVAAVSAASFPSVSAASPAGLPAVGTLAPAAQTQGGSPLDPTVRHDRERRTGILLACAGMLALGAAVALVIFTMSGRGSDPRLHATGEPPAVSSGEPQTASPSAAVAAPPATDGAVASSSASSTATSSAGPSATPSVRATATARPRGPAITRPQGNGRRNDGLLDHP